MILKIGFSNHHTESKKFQPHGYSGSHAYLKSATNNYLQRQPKAKPLRVRTVARVSAPMLCFEKWGQKGDGTAPLPTAAALRVKGCKLEYLELSDFMLLLSFGLLEVVVKGNWFFKGQTNSKLFFEADISSKNRTNKFDLFLFGF